VRPVTTAGGRSALAIDRLLAPRSGRAIARGLTTVVVALAALGPASLAAAGLAAAGLAPAGLAAAGLAAAGLAAASLAPATFAPASLAAASAQQDPAARAVATPACFGAAARDPEHPCVNDKLNLTATPTPYDAPLQPSAACTPISHVSPRACAFGAPSRDAASTVALLGDSHATAWRAAVAVVADDKRWHGVSITRNSCPFTFARTPGAGRCKGWAGSVLRWLRRHPEVRQVIVGANSGSGVVAAEGQGYVRTKIDGYVAAWKAIPRSVRDVFVLRDVPHSRSGTAECVSRAIARRRNPALRCARRRRGALLPDLAAVAADRTDSDRVKLVDLTPFMCDDDVCFPVVGGALVIRDIGHLTRTFSTTLGPYLGRAISRLPASAPPAP
jgi:hypothetical protein